VTGGEIEGKTVAFNVNDDGLTKGGWKLVKER
jgi:hypothetical protein